MLDIFHVNNNIDAQFANVKTSARAKSMKHSSINSITSWAYSTVNYIAISLFHNIIIYNSIRQHFCSYFEALNINATITTNITKKTDPNEKYSFCAHSLYSSC